MFSRIGPRFTSSSSSFSLFSSVPISRTANPGRWKCVQRRGYGAGWGPRPQYKRFNQAQHQRGGWLLRWAAKPTFFRDVAVISAGAGGFFIWNLEEVPISGRRRFNIINSDLEASISERSMEEIKQQYRGRFLPDYDPRVRQVQRVLDRLIPFAEKAGLTGVHWEVHVIESPEQNAFVIPGGKVFVFTGILPMCKTEDGIAAVLGHEIAHVVAHHPAERMSQMPFVLLGAIALSLFDVSFYTSKMLIDLVLSLPGSRRQEEEADYIGLMMMAQACYRPEAAANFWARMERADKGSPPQMLSTHPSHHNRQEKIQEWLPKAHSQQEASECHGLYSYTDQFARAFGNQTW